MGIVDRNETEEISREEGDPRHAVRVTLPCRGVQGALRGIPPNEAGSPRL